MSLLAYVFFCSCCGSAWVRVSWLPFLLTVRSSLPNLSISPSLPHSLFVLRLCVFAAILLEGYIEPPRDDDDDDDVVELIGEVDPRKQPTTLITL